MPHVRLSLLDRAGFLSTDALVERRGRGRRDIGLFQDGFLLQQVLQLDYFF